MKKVGIALVLLSCIMLMTTCEQEKEKEVPCIVPETTYIYDTEYTSNDTEDTSATFDTEDTSNAAETTTPITPPKPKEVRLDVENILQNPEFKNGCEVVSLAICLKYAGVPISTGELYDKYMAKSPLYKGDPWESYVGDAKGNGLGCYAPCVVITGNAYLTEIKSDKKVYDVSENDFSYYEALIDDGYPVIMWGTVGMNGNDTVYWQTNIGKKHIVWYNYSHCVVLIGYTENTYIFCDPLAGVAEYKKSDVEKSFSITFRQACVIK